MPAFVLTFMISCLDAVLSLLNHHIYRSTRFYKHFHELIITIFKGG